ncbi:MAG: isopentenyl phosphate kinase [archaeon]|jgi:isopentenyl phosphate kinase
MEDLIVIKLGGSSITKKADNKFEMNYDVLNESAKEIALAVKEKKLKLIVVCGAGPFGHTNVIKYDLNNGIKTKEQEKGTEITIKDCNFVGEETVSALEKVGLKAKLIPGYEVCKQDSKKVISFETEEYLLAIKEGFIPVTTGTMVKDKSFKWSVMSGDKVIAQLAKQLKPKKVIMGTDVDGIYTADPKADSKAELIEEITKENVPKILEKVGESKSVDVTGGMKGKLTQLSEQLNGTPAEIFNLFTKDNLYKTLVGKKIKCTKITL